LNRVRIFIIVRFYLPGYKTGGPLRSISNIVEHFGDRFDFYILTNDRDWTDAAAYPSVTQDAWNDVGRAKVFYSSQFSFSLLRRLLAEVAPAAVYLNSVFSPLTVRLLCMRRLEIIPRIPVIIAPRGELADSALAIKGLKKKCYLWFANRAGLYNRLTWHATWAQEAEEIRRTMDRAANIHLAPNIPKCLCPVASPSEKTKGKLRLIFLSRICSVKNLLFGLQVLRNLVGDVILDIYGPIDQNSYWAACEKAIASLPAQMTVSYKGSVQYSEVATTLSRYHFLFLPTTGENFGHIIFEALSVGCPVIISDRTQWRNLQAKAAGWDLPLEDRPRWFAVLQRCVEMDEHEYRGLSEGAQRVAKEVDTKGAVFATLELFDAAIARNSLTEAIRQ